IRSGKLARFEPEQVAQLHRNGWHKPNRYIHMLHINKSTVNFVNEIVIDIVDWSILLKIENDILLKLFQINIPLPEHIWNYVVITIRHTSKKTMLSGIYLPVN